MPMYNLIEYSDIYLKKSETLWQYYRDEPALTALTIFSIFLLIVVSFKFKENIAGKAGKNSTK